VERLKLRFPEDGILCEEEKDDASRLARTRTWIIDPMDGTSEFVANLGEFAVMIGLAVEGKPALGVVYQPTVKKLYYAATGQGAYREESNLAHSMRVSPESDFSRVVVAVSRSHDSSESQRIRKNLGFERVIHSGSAGLKVGMICEGKAHLYFHLERGTSQWDTCAPDIILREAGGRMTDMAGRPLIYNRSERGNLGGIIASNGIIHDAVVRAAKIGSE
jgi:3'(2'), 5'-bisphosphate nucleotidase